MDFFNRLAEISFNDNLVSGSIIWRFERQFYEPKDKFSIIVGISDDKTEVARVFINKNVNIHALKTQEMIDLQVDISNSCYSFLSTEYTHSFIDCSKVTITDIESLKNEYFNRPDQFFVSKLTPEHLSKVIPFLKSASTIKPIVKKTFRLE